MPFHRHPAIQWLLTTIAILFGVVTARLPLPLCRGVGRVLGLIAYGVIPRVRRVALANLDIAYGDMLTPREKRRIARGAAQNMGIVAAEFSHIPQIHGAFLEKYVTIRGADQVDRSKGSLMIAAHLGNWEWMAPVVHKVGFRIHEVVRPLDDPRMNRLVDDMRRAGGVTTIDKYGAGREVIRLLREGASVGILVDQSPRENGVPVRFFGRDTWGTIAVALAQRRTGVPVHIFSFTRNAQGHYTMAISPPLEFVRTDDLRADLVANAQRCQDAVEIVIREHPEQWLWLHRRWKPRPGLEAEWAARAERKPHR